MREKEYKSPKRKPRMIVQSYDFGDRREQDVPHYDHQCTHFIEKGLGRCELKIPMCCCKKGCLMSTSDRVLEYPRCRLKETR